MRLRAGPSIYFEHAPRSEFELLHDGYAIGYVSGAANSSRILFATQDVALGVEREGADADPGPERSHLRRIVGGKPNDGVRLGVG